MSIIELMVGVVVALLLGLAATGSALMFNAAQRQAWAPAARWSMPTPRWRR